jgi:hypothetical protein
MLALQGNLSRPDNSQPAAGRRVCHSRGGTDRIGMVDMRARRYVHLTVLGARFGDLAAFGRPVARTWECGLPHDEGSLIAAMTH